jgi:CBS domain-containing protein
VGASLADVVHTMRERACRRIPLTEDGQPVGLVTLDDLMVDGEISQGTRLIVAAQLDAEARRARGRRKDRSSGLRATAGEPSPRSGYRRSA